MGAVLKLDPTRIKTAEFWKVQGDPLARALRNRFKRDGQYSKRKFQCVYSDELLKNQKPIDPDDKNIPSGIVIAVIILTKRERHFDEGSMSSGQLEHGAGTFSARCKNILCTALSGILSGGAVPTIHNVTLLQS